ncbi:MAG: hypothetical protein MK080_01705 [Opitutales bacterium]|nr:hypothetical protein [Opitutales bacterium]
MSKSLFKRLYPFLWLPLVVVPVALTLCYHLFFAAEEYESSASVIIKENQSGGGPTLPGMAGALFDYGNSTSVEDAYILREYLQSDAFFTELSTAFDLTGHYSTAGFPWLQRMSSQPDASDIADYMTDKVAVSVSPDTSILTIAVRSFSPEFSTKLVEHLITTSEARINQLSSRIADSRMELARSEYAKAEKSFRGAKEAVLTFQTENGWLDSSTEISADFGRVNMLRNALVEKKLERERLLSVLRPNALNVRSLEDEISAIERQLTEIEENLVGSVADSSLTVSAEYNRLNLDVEFELNKYTASLAALQQAQLEASQQQKFLLVVAPAISLNDATYPSPTSAALTVLVVSFLIYLLTRLIVSTVLDHTI